MEVLTKETTATEALESLARCVQVSDLALQEVIDAHDDAVEPRAKMKELRFKQLPDDLKPSMEEAMIKQLDEHFKYDALEGVNISTSVPDDRTLSSRMLLTNKGQMTDDWKAKARLIWAPRRSQRSGWRTHRHEQPYRSLHRAPADLDHCGHPVLAGVHGRCGGGVLARRGARQRGLPEGAVAA
jgi:hypothetical protein